MVLTSDHTTNLPSRIIPGPSLMAAPLQSSPKLAPATSQCQACDNPLVRSTYQKAHTHENANCEEATQIRIGDDGTDDWHQPHRAIPVVGVLDCNRQVLAQHCS